MQTREFDEMWERLSERLGEATRIFAAESREAAIQANELLALPPRLRARKLRAEPRFRSTALVLELICRARVEAERRNRPERALPALRTALAILRRLRASSGTLPAGLRELQAEALCELGEIWRRLGSTAWAESYLEQAAQALRDSPDSLTRALFCSRLARLRVDQERGDEAVALFARAALLWDQVGNVEPSAGARIEQGLARLQVGEIDHPCGFSETQVGAP